MTQPTGSIVVQAWRERGSIESDLETIIDIVLGHERAMRDAYREHVDSDAAAKSKINDLRAKFDAGTLRRADIVAPAPGKPPDPIQEIDARRADTIEELIKR